jgi:septal ring factor EnvC (AmiA/AmiB activator)
MITNEIGQILHNKAVQGVDLLPEEQVQLQEWYEDLDREEMKLLKLNSGTPQSSSLQSQVDKTVAQFSVVSKRIQELASENDTLRKENALLRQKLAQLIAQPA